MITQSHTQWTLHVVGWSLHDFGWNTFRAWSQRHVAVVQEDLRAQLRKMEAGASDQQNVEAFYMVLNRVGSQHTQHTLLGLRRISTRLSTSYSSDENLTEFSGWQFLIQPWLEWQSLFNRQGATDVRGTCVWELLKEVWQANQSSVSIATLWLWHTVSTFLQEGLRVQLRKVEAGVSDQQKLEETWLCWADQLQLRWSRMIIMNGTSVCSLIILRPNPFHMRTCWWRGWTSCFKLLPQLRNHPEHSIKKINDLFMTDAKWCQYGIIIFTEPVLIHLLVAGRSPSTAPEDRNWCFRAAKSWGQDSVESVWRLSSPSQIWRMCKVSFDVLLLSHTLLHVLLHAIIYEHILYCIYRNC